MTTAFVGIGVCGSRPVAIGAAYVLARDPVATQATILPGHVDAELTRLDSALE